MPDTITTRSEQLIAEAESGAKDYAARINGDRSAALNYEIGILRSLVRSLSDAVNLQAESIATQTEEIQRQRGAMELLNGTIRRQRNQIREQDTKLQDLQFRLIGDDDVEADSEELRRRIAAFNRSTGASTALRGEA